MPTQCERTIGTCMFTLGKILSVEIWFVAGEVPYEESVTWPPQATAITMRDRHFVL